MTWPPPTHPKVQAEIEKLKVVWADREPLGFDTVYHDHGRVAHVLVWADERRIDARTVMLEEV